MKSPMDELEWQFLTAGEKVLGIKFQPTYAPPP